MSITLNQHQVEIQKNREFWEKKPLLRLLYAGFYNRIIAFMDQNIPGRIVEIGSGIGNLKQQLPEALATDLFPNPWLDLVCDGYELPFRDDSLSHLILFDVFHHLEAPNAFLKEAKRALHPQGRLILFEPFISCASLPVYGLAHHEPVGMNKKIDARDRLPPPRHYYAAQGNATRLFSARSGMTGRRVGPFSTPKRSPLSVTCFPEASANRRFIPSVSRARWAKSTASCPNGPACSAPAVWSV